MLMDKIWFCRLVR